MIKCEDNLISGLYDLKKNHNVCALKTEFEVEGASFSEVQKLSEFANEIGLDFVVKIGGCGAVRDIIDAKTIGATTLVCPMVETGYSLEKFIESVEFVYSSEELKNTDLFINIETITGINNFDGISKLRCFDEIKGCVLGRADLTLSMGLLRENVNDNKIFDIALNLSSKLKAFNKEMIVGGNVTMESFDFFKKMPKGNLTKIETRKVVFDAKRLLDNGNTDTAIKKAIEFEVLWLQYKKDFFKNFLEKDEKRLINLQKMVKLNV